MITFTINQLVYKMFDKLKHMPKGQIITDKDKQQIFDLIETINQFIEIETN